MITLTLDLQRSVADLSPQEQIIAQVISDWMGILASEKPWSPVDHGAFLKSLSAHTSSCSPDLQHWRDGVIGGPLSDKLLVYRQYILTHVFAGDIHLTGYDVNWYLLIASSLLADRVFVGGIPSTLWGTIDQDCHPINKLREQQPLVRRFVHNLWAQDHPFSDQPWVDHGIVSSVSLLYGLYIGYALMSYHAKLDPRPAIHQVTQAFQDALLKLKGSLCHGTYQWLETDVR
jgi:hypothetical protein